MSYRGLALATNTTAFAHTLPAATHKLINGIKICYAYYEQLVHVWWHTVKIIILPQPARKLIANSPIHCLGFILLVHFARGAWALLFDGNDFFLSYFRPFCSIFFVLLCCSRWAEIAEYLSESVTFSCTFGFSEWFSYGSIESNRIASIRMEWNGMESIWVSMTSMRIKPCKWLLLYSRFSSLLRQAHPIYIGGGGGESEMEWEDTQRERHAYSGWILAISSLIWFLVVCGGKVVWFRYISNFGLAFFVCVIDSCDRVARPYCPFKPFESRGHRMLCHFIFSAVQIMALTFGSSGE